MLQRWSKHDNINRELFFKDNALQASDRQNEREREKTQIKRGGESEREIEREKEIGSQTSQWGNDGWQSEDLERLGKSEWERKKKKKNCYNFIFLNLFLIKN